MAVVGACSFDLQISQQVIIIGEILSVLIVTYQTCFSWWRQDSWRAIKLIPVSATSLRFFFTVVASTVVSLDVVLPFLVFALIEHVPIIDCLGMGCLGLLTISVTIGALSSNRKAYYQMLYISSLTVSLMLSLVRLWIGIISLLLVIWVPY